MPIEFEAILERGRRMQISTADTEKAASRVAYALTSTQSFDEGWDSEYRTMYILSGSSIEAVNTLEDVNSIDVPPLRLIKGQLDGNQLQLTERYTAWKEGEWKLYPVFEDEAQESEHLAFRLHGEMQGRYTVVQWKEGRIDMEPDPPDDQLELLENVARSLNGADAEDWESRHLQFGGHESIPVAKRGTLDMKKVAPLFSSAHAPFVRHQGLEFWPLMPLEYSLDGKKWTPYPNASEAGAAETEQDEEETFDLLASLLDPQLLSDQAVSVIIRESGEIEWQDELEEKYLDTLSAAIKHATGAGTSLWKEKAGEITGSNPIAIQFQVMKALVIGGMPEQAFAASAFTVDGENWEELEESFSEDDES